MNSPVNVAEVSRVTFDDEATDPPMKVNRRASLSLVSSETCCRKRESVGKSSCGIVKRGGDEVDVLGTGKVVLCAGKRDLKICNSD